VTRWALVMVAACGAAAPEPLHAPERRPHAEPPDEATPIDDCTTDFHRPAVPRVATNPAATRRGDQLVADADHRSNPDELAAGYVAAVDAYRSALLADPYNADLTLALALAYDRVYRKGCALQLLRRLDALAASKQFGGPARAAIAKVADNTQWFRTYRRDVDAALGR
jgi:hypothetical protein